MQGRSITRDRLFFVLFGNRIAVFVFIAYLLYTFVAMKRRGNKRIMPALDALIQSNRLQDAIMERYNLRYSSLRDLIDVYTNWLNSDEGLRPISIIRSKNRYYVSRYPALIDRLEILRNKGLIQQLSQYKYIPTDQAIKELNELLRSA